MVIITLFASLCTFFIDHNGDIASKMVASAGYDILKNTLNFQGLIGKIKGFFVKEDHAEKFVEQVCNQQISKDENPEKALRLAFEKATGQPFPTALLDELKFWFENNKEAIMQASNISFNSTSGFNVGTQQAKGNIYNIQGDFNTENGKKRD